MACDAFEHALAMRDSRNARDEPERRACPLEHRSLLDMYLEEEPRALTRGREGGAPHIAALFIAEDDDGARSDALDCLDAGDDAESTVEFASLRHRVEV